MSWASRRRTIYAFGIVLFFAVVVGIPLSVWIYQPPSCNDGKQNQEETGVDIGGPCPILDSRALIPENILWSRAFPSRDGTYSAVAVIENPNQSAGVRAVGFRFGLYDSRNILVAEKIGSTFVMPGGITPIFQSGIETGNRAVTRTYFAYTEAPVWQRMENAAAVLSITNKQVEDADSRPRLSADVENTAVTPVLNPSFVAVVFDPAGNAFSASATTLTRLNAGEKREIVFTWFDPFPAAVGRVDVYPVVQPLTLSGS